MNKWLVLLPPAALAVVLSLPAMQTAHRPSDVCEISENCFGIIDEIREPILVRVAMGDVRIRYAGPSEPLQGATVEVFGPAPSKSLRVAKTNAQGRFRVKDLPPGTYGLHVFALGFNSTAAELIVSRRSPRNNRIHIEATLGH